MWFPTNKALDFGCIDSHSSKNRDEWGTLGDRDAHKDQQQLVDLIANTP
jgi:hypothetical protein